MGSRAEKIRNLKDEELAEYLMDVATGLLFDKRIMNVKKWIKDDGDIREN